MRVSLYPHELAVVERLTLAIVREAVIDGGVPPSDVTSISVTVFEALLDVLYARGFYKHPWRTEPDRSAAGLASPQQFYQADADFREVTK